MKEDSSKFQRWNMKTDVHHLIDDRIGNYFVPVILPGCAPDSWERF